MCLQPIHPESLRSTTAGTISFPRLRVQPRGSVAIFLKATQEREKLIHQVTAGLNRKEAVRDASKASVPHTIAILIREARLHTRYRKLFVAPRPVLQLRHRTWKQLYLLLLEYRICRIGAVSYG